MLSETDTDRPLGSVKLRARFEQVERCPDHGRAGGGPRRMIVAAPHLQTFAANGSRFAVPICYEIGVGDATGSVKDLVTDGHILEHIHRP
jgi:hypothetical protein